MKSSSEAPEKTQMDQGNELCEPDPPLDPPLDASLEPAADRAEGADEASGLDVLAATIDRVADDLPRRFESLDGPIERLYEDSLEPNSGFFGTRGRGSGSRNGRALAAGFLLGTLILPLSWLWSTGLEEPPEPGGVATLEWLSSGRQGARGSDEPVATVSPSSSGPTVLMVDVPQAVRVGLRAGARLQLKRIGAGEEHTVVDQTIAAQAWAASLERSDGLPVWLDQDVLLPGSYGLTLGPSADASEPLLVLEFRVPEPAE